MCWHRWSKWKIQETPGFEVILRGPAAGQKINTVFREQHRECLKCGKIQIEKLER